MGQDYMRWDCYDEIEHGGIVGWNKMGQGRTGLDETGWSRMAWDGMQLYRIGRDGLRWEKRRWDGIR